MDGRVTGGFGTVRAVLDSTQLAQRSPTTCGVAALIAARVVVDPAFARQLDSIDLDVLERRVSLWLSGGRTAAGWIWPWPRALGTAPWAMAVAMSHVVGQRYRVALVNPHPGVARATKERLVTAAQGSVAAGSPVPLYVGNATLPRHIVLVLPGNTRDIAEVFEPGVGRIQQVRWDALLSGEFTLGGWSRWWAAVL